MKNEEGKTCVREKDEACIALLRQLKQKLRARNISIARLAAFNLSWMQEVRNKRRTRTESRGIRGPNSR